MADTTKEIVYKIHVEGDGMATIRDMKGQIIATQVPLKNLRKEFGNFAKTVDGAKFDKFNAGLKETRKQMDGFNASTGSSTSAALELSRVIQDAPFGMRGMANNLSQLSASLAFASKQAGSFTAAIKGMFAALRGPLGILVAIEAVMAAFQIFSSTTKDAEDAVDSFNEKTKETVESLEKQATQLDNVAKSMGKLSEEAAAGGIIKATESFKGLNEQLRNGNLTLEDKIALVKEYASQLRFQAQVEDAIAKAQTLAFDSERDILEEIEKVERQIAEARNYDPTFAVKRLEDLKEELATFREIEDVLGRINGDSGEKGRLAILKQSKKMYTKLREEQSSTNSQYKVFSGILEEIQKQIEAIEGKKERTGGRTRIKIFKQQLFDLQKEINGFNEAWLRGTERTALGRLEIQQEFEKKDLDLKRDAFVEKQKQRLAHEKEMLKLNKITNAEYLRAEELVNESILEAEEEHQRALTAIRKKHDQERFDLFLKDLERSVEEYIKASNAEEIAVLRGGVSMDSGVDRVEQEMALNERLYDHKIEQINREIEARKEAGEIYSGLEKERTAMEEVQRIKRLQMERKLWEAKVAVVGLGVQAIAQIAAEGSAIQKAASVASTIISTYEAATAALGAKPWGPWNIASAAAVTAMGLANVSKILSTKIPGESSVGGGGSAPSGPTFSPSFNVVGNNQQSQLANTIAEQTAQPVQAFVVYDDIETAAQLEQGAVNSTGF